jgi:sialate O-acetylesterase
MKKIFFYSLLLSSFFASAQVRFARIFSDHAVLQRQKNIPVWGWASANEKVTVSLAKQSLVTKANADGRWQVSFSPMEAGGPHTLSAKGNTNSTTVSDILIGEVWICSGQSNMEWTVDASNNAKAEIRNGDFPEIRHFKVSNALSMKPETDLNTGEWKICNPSNVGQFTAVGYFMARELYQKLKVPIGLMNTSWGGSQVEGWISKDAMMASPELKNYAQTMPATWEESDQRTDSEIKTKFWGKSDAKVTLAEEANYTKSNFDVSKWLSVGFPSSLDWQGLWSFRGKAYVSRSVTIPAHFVSQNTVLSFGRNDSECAVWINGKLIEKSIKSEQRIVKIPLNTWKEGENTIVLSIGTIKEPSWYGVGLHGGSEEYFVEYDGEKITLAGNGWKAAPSIAEPYHYEHLNNSVGTTIYNAMLAPLIPMAMRGAIWYQGETNADRAYQYRKTFPLMINDWRKRWNDEFPFLFVQLSSFGANQNSNEGSNWAELREAQTMTLALSKTGMAVCTDVGDPKDIHPTNKQDVGKRLAASALSVAYGQSVPSSPLYENVVFKNDKAIVSFSAAPNGLMAKDRYGYVRGFEIAGPDKVFYYAQAQIIGNKIEVSHPKVSSPASVRYAWSNSPDEANLFNTEGFPVSAFRTDSWTGVTEARVFK